MKNIGTSNLSDRVVQQRAVMEVRISNRPERLGTITIAVWMDSETAPDNFTDIMPESSFRGWAHQYTLSAEDPPARLSKDERTYLSACLHEAATQISEWDNEKANA